jgi:hypothetical protein
MTRRAKQSVPRVTPRPFMPLGRALEIAAFTLDDVRVPAGSLEARNTRIQAARTIKRLHWAISQETDAAKILDIIRLITEEHPDDTPGTADQPPITG